MEDGSGSGDLQISLPEFSTSEIMVMKSIFEDLREDSLEKELCLEVATGFSCTRCDIGEPVITWEQVQNWFQEKQKEFQAKSKAKAKAKVSSSGKLPGKFAAIGLEDKPASYRASKKFHGDFAYAVVPDAEPERFETWKGKIEFDYKEMLYEAQSAKENGWYDVAQFRNFRHNKTTGELEVYVRFKGFDREEDEWVNVKRQVRKRSIPLVPSECHMIKVGDDVMSHRVSRREAVYYDCRVVNIERNYHDTTDCSCVFEVCYAHSYRKENVLWKNLCRRP